MKLKQEPSTRVLELKARVLAGQSDHVIAQRLGLPTRTVATFVGLFFDVRPRLKANTWISQQAIGVHPWLAPSVENLLLLHVWKRGPAMIEPWLDYLQHQEERHDLCTEIGRQRAWIELLIRVQQLPFNPETLRSLWKLSYFALGESPKTVESVTVNATVLRIRDQILTELAWKESENEELKGIDKSKQTMGFDVNRKFGRCAQAG
jgi:hypothetical protein